MVPTVSEVWKEESDVEVSLSSFELRVAIACTCMSELNTGCPLLMVQVLKFWSEFMVTVKIFHVEYV